MNRNTDRTIYIESLGMCNAVGPPKLYFVLILNTLAAFRHHNKLLFIKYYNTLVFCLNAGYLTNYGVFFSKG